MRRYRPLTANTRPAFSHVRGRDQAYDTLTLPAAGELSWSAPNHIIAYFRVTLDAFAIVSAPTTLLPLYVRDQGTRYLVVAGSPAPDVYAPTYTGQTLTSTAVFEFWSAGDPASVVLPEYELTISLRTQLCCCPSEAGTSHSAILYTPYCLYYPVCFPICAH